MVANALFQEIGQITVIGSNPIVLTINQTRKCAKFDAKRSRNELSERVINAKIEKDGATPMYWMNAWD